MEAGLAIPVEYVRTIDGDTFEFEIRRKFKVRLRDIDTPEINTKKGVRAKETVECELESADDILVFIPTNSPEHLMDIVSFERVVADVYINGHNLASMLKLLGYEK